MDRGQCPAPYRIAACGFQILIVYLINGLAVFGYELKRETENEGEWELFYLCNRLDWEGEEVVITGSWCIFVLDRFQLREYYLMPPRRDRRLGTSLILSVKVE
jgi:hypothetical protein